MYDKIDVNGAGAHPLYSWLKAAQQVSAPGEVRSRPNGDIEWNYTKVGRLAAKALGRSCAVSRLRVCVYICTLAVRVSGVGVRARVRACVRAHVHAYVHAPLGRCHSPIGRWACHARVPMPGRTAGAGAGACHGLAGRCSGGVGGQGNMLPTRRWSFAAHALHVARCTYAPCVDPPRAAMHVAPGTNPGVSVASAAVIVVFWAQFLIDRNGQPIKRYKPSFDPLNMEDDVGRAACQGQLPPSVLTYDLSHTAYLLHV